MCHSVQTPWPRMVVYAVMIRHDVVPSKNRFVIDVKLSVHDLNEPDQQKDLWFIPLIHATKNEPMFRRLLQNCAVCCAYTALIPCLFSATWGVLILTSVTGVRYIQSSP